MTQLDNQQKAAVITDSIKALVLAGAGSGKTRVLTERIAHLIEEKKVSAFEIMAFSFTRKASGEIRTRLEDRIGSDAHKINMGTMHGIALNLIQRFGEMIGLKGKNVTVYSEWESNYLLNEIAVELGYKKKTWTKIKKKEIDAVFADYYERGIEPDKDDKCYGLFKAFIRRCQENNALTYGALLIGLEMLIHHIKQHLHIKHILVDEIQDVDPLQWCIIHSMCNHFNAALFVCGDIDQSLYSFRGAVPEYLIQHENEFDIFRIESNYRSDANIVEAANNLIQHNVERLEKTMLPIKTHDRGVETVYNMSSQDIVDMITTFKHIYLKEITIIAPFHYLLEKTARLMDEQGIPNTYIGKQTKLTNSEEFRRFHSFLKLIVNPYDNFSFLLIRELIGLSREEYNHIRLAAIQEGKSHFQAWYNSADPYENNIFISFFDSIEQWNFSELINSLHSIWELTLSDWIEDTQPNEKPFDFDPSIEFACQWFEDNPDGTIHQYLTWLACYDLQEEIKEDNEGVQLMTIHAAKGLEFPTVIIAGLNEGVFPSTRSIREGTIEDIRRLMYVAVTRAEDRLILTVRPQAVEKYGKIENNPVSRFIGEMS